jgi:hypothetical protein
MGLVIKNVEEEMQMRDSSSSSPAFFTLKDKQVQAQHSLDHEASYLKKLSTLGTRTVAPYIYDLIPVSIVTDVDKAKGFGEQVKMIAKRLYLEKHQRLPMKTRVLVNGIQSWCYAFFKNDLHLVENAHDELGSTAFHRGIGDRVHDPQKGREAFEQHNWAMNRKRKFRNHIRRKEFKNGPLLLQCLKKNFKQQHTRLGMMA